MNATQAMLEVMKKSWGMCSCVTNDGQPCATLEKVKQEEEHYDALTALNLPDDAPVRDTFIGDILMKELTTLNSEYAEIEATLNELDAATLPADAIEAGASTDVFNKVRTLAKDNLIQQRWVLSDRIDEVENQLVLSVLEYRVMMAPGHARRMHERITVGALRGVFDAIAGGVMFGGEKG